MGIDFDWRIQSPDVYFVFERGQEGRVAAMGTADGARRYAEYLTEEHRDGRVAQGSCSKGHACDRDRVNDAMTFVAAEQRPLVLCQEHRTEIEALS